MANREYLSRYDYELHEMINTNLGKKSNLTYINYKEIGGLSSESCQALELARPSDLASAARIPGVTAAALSSVLLFTKKKVKKVVQR